MPGGAKQTQSQQQQSTSSNQIDPAQLALLTQNYNGAQQKASSLTPYTGQLTAGFTPTQTQAQGILSGVATDPSYAANNNTALSSISGILGSNNNTNVNAAPVNAAQIGDTDLSKYLNPYTNDVINTTIADQDRARQIANISNDQKASAAGAFGGSRSGVINANTNEGYDRNTGSLIAGLNQANYNNALGVAGTDVAAQNQTNQFNSTQNVNAQQSSIANALAQQGLKLNAAGQLVSDNQAALGMAAQQGGILSAVGDAQQQQNQTELTNAYNAYTQGQQLTVEQQQLLNSALGLIPTQQTVSNSGSSNGTTSTTSNPGLAGILGGVASLGLGIGSLGTGSILGKALS